MTRASGKLHVLAASCILVAGCGTVANSPTVPLDIAALEAAENWEFHGRVAVNSQGRGVQANVWWRQEGPLAILELSGPWGVGAERVRIMGEEIHLWSDDDWIPMCEPEMAVEELEFLCTGAPLGRLSFWLRGLTDPGYPFMEFDSGQGAAREFQQQGWQVAVNALASSGDLTVPRRLLIAGPDTTLKVAITDWTLSASP